MIEIIYKVNQVIINPLIILLLATASLVFLWGILQFLAGMESEEKRATGKKHMLWGIIGLFIMVAVFGIIKIILGTFGISAPGGIIP